MSNYGSQRCPRCGNENRADSFACSFCGKRLRTERIEKFLIFKRIEEDWTNPAPWYIILLWLLLRPNKAFWEINHRRKSAPAFKIMIINSLLYGLTGLTLFSKFSFIGTIDFIIIFLFGLSAFIVFFLFGFIFYFLFAFILTLLFSTGANIAVGFSERLKARFGEEAKEKYREEEMSPFSIYKGGTLHQQQAHKYRMLLCSFAPFFIINVISILIILIGAPHTVVTVVTDPNTFTALFSSPIWQVIYTIEALTIAIWVPILVTLAIRDLSNSSTSRVLLSSLIIGVTMAILFYFLRPVFYS